MNDSGKPTRTLVERFVVHDGDGIEYRVECRRDDADHGLRHCQLENGERLIQIDGTTFMQAFNGKLLHRNLTKGWPRPMN